MFRPFVDVLKVPGGRWPLLAGFLGALPIGMLNLGVLLFVRDATGSLATAGAAVAVLSVGNAIGLAVQGAAIGRWGQPRVLVGGAVVCPASLAGLVLFDSIPCVLLAGASLPATTSCMRLLWPHLVADPRRRVAAYALLAVQFQIALVVGPPVVSALVLLHGPGTAVLAAAALAAAGGLVFAATPAARRWRPSRAASAAGGGFARGGMWTLFSAVFLGGVAGGAMIVAVPAVAGPALAGLLFAAYSAGELAGGVIYGGRAWPLRPVVRLAVCQAGTAVCLALFAFLSAAPVLFVLGALAAPAAIVSSALLDDLTDARRLARAYPAMVSAGLTGVAAGSWVAGVLIPAHGSPVALLAAAGVSAVSAGWTMVRREALTRGID